MYFGLDQRGQANTEAYHHPSSVRGGSRLHVCELDCWVGCVRVEECGEDELRYEDHQPHTRMLWCLQARVRTENHHLYKFQGMLFHYCTRYTFNMQ